VGLSMPDAASRTRYRFRHAAGRGASLCADHRCYVVNDVPCRDRLLPVFYASPFHNW
jgi:hypothetical protein